MQRGGQVTIFVALGLVIIIATGLVVFALLSRTDTAPAQDLLEYANRQLASSIVGTCLDTIVTDEFTILGESGSLPSEDGFPSAITQVKGQERRVLFGITKKQQMTPMLPPPYSVPRYPDEGVGLANTTINPRTGRAWPAFVDGYFGDVNFPAPCSVSGENAPHGSNPCRRYPGNPPGTEGPATQEGLERRIAQRVQACASAEKLSEALGQEVVRIERPSVQVALASRAVVVDLSYLLELRGGAVRATEPFTRSYPVRYRQLAEFVHDLAHKETQDIGFDLERDFAQLRSYRDGFLVTRIDGVPIAEPLPHTFSPMDASLIVVTDTQSTLLAEDYRFFFLIEHRPPMLDQVRDFPHASAIASGTVIGGIDPDDLPVDFILAGDESAWNLTVTDGDGERDWQAS